MKSTNCWVGGRPEEKGDERMRRWWEEGGGGDDAEGNEASLDTLVARTAGLINNKPVLLLLKQRSAAVLRARALPPLVTNDSMVRGDLGLGKE